MGQLAISLLLFFSTSFAAEPDCSKILVEDADGASIVITAGGEKRELEIDDSLGKGDAVATGKEAWVDLRLCDGSGLRVGEKSKMAFEEAFSALEQSWTAWAFDLLKGTLLATVSTEEMNGKVKMRVRTATAAMGIRGTEFLVDASSPEDTVVQTLEGEVLVGKREDYENLAKPDFSRFQARFESLAKERMSRVRRDQAPEKPVVFRLQEVRERRKDLFQHQLERTDRKGFTERVERANERREERKEQREQIREKRHEENRGNLHEFRGQKPDQPRRQLLPRRGQGGRRR